MSQYKSAKGDKASGKGKYLKDPGVPVNFSIFRVFFVFRLIFVFVSCFDLFSCLFRVSTYFRVCFVFRLVVFVFVSIYTKHETRGFRVSCSHLYFEISHGLFLIPLPLSCIITCTCTVYSFPTICTSICTITCTSYVDISIVKVCLTHPQKALAPESPPKTIMSWRPLISLLLICLLGVGYLFGALLLTTSQNWYVCHIIRVQ